MVILIMSTCVAAGELPNIIANSPNPSDECKAAYTSTRAVVDAGIKSHRITEMQYRSGYTGIPGKHEDNTGKITSYTFDKPVLFIHIGKAGGGAVQSHLRGAGIAFDPVHVSYAPRNAILSHNWVVVCVRDPVTRFVSAYNWGNPDSARCRTRKKKKGKDLARLKFFYKCFPNVTAWVSAFRRGSGRNNISGSNGSARNDCEQIAFNAKGIEDIHISHISVKTESSTYSSPLVACSYIGLFLNDDWEKPSFAHTLQHLHVIQTEQLDDDFVHFKNVLEMHEPDIVKNKGYHVGAEGGVKVLHVGIHTKRATTFEPDLQKYLEAMLAPEYLVLNRIMQLSANKNESNYY